MEAFLITALTIFGGFLIHTLLGFGGALFAIPILATIYTVPESVALMAFLYMFFSAYMSWKHYKDMNKKEVALLGISALGGIIIGSLFLSAFEAPTLKKLLGIFILGYLIYNHIKKTDVVWLKKLGIPLGVLSGIFSILFGTGGPPIAAYLSNKLKGKHELRASMIGVQTFLHFVVSPILLATGHVEFTFFREAFYLIPFFLSGLIIGQKLYHTIDDRRFTQLLHLVLLLSALNLLR